MHARSNSLVSGCGLRIAGSGLGLGVVNGSNWSSWHFHNVPDAVAKTLRSVEKEFADAEKQKYITARLGRKYHNALAAYENVLLNGIWSPGSIIGGLSASDEMMREKMRQELERVSKEYSRILNHFGGALSLIEDADES